MTTLNTWVSKKWMKTTVMFNDHLDPHYKKDSGLDPDNRFPKVPEDDQEENQEEPWWKVFKK